MVDRKVPRHGMSSVKEFQAALEYIKCHDVALLQSPPTLPGFETEKSRLQNNDSKKEKEQIVN